MREIGHLTDTGEVLVAANQTELDLLRMLQQVAIEHRPAWPSYHQATLTEDLAIEFKAIAAWIVMQDKVNQLRAAVDEFDKMMKGGNE